MHSYDGIIEFDADTNSACSRILAYDIRYLLNFLDQCLRNLVNA
jgi:hypothetical protein